MIVIIIIIEMIIIVMEIRYNSSESEGKLSHLAIVLNWFFLLAAGRDYATTTAQVNIHKQMQTIEFNWKKLNKNGQATLNSPIDFPSKWKHKYKFKLLKTLCLQTKTFSFFGRKSSIMRV